MTKLSTPDLTQASPITTETRPKVLAEWLNRLPLANLDDASRRVHGALAACNRLALPADGRFKLLELYRATVLRMVAALEGEFATASLPLTEPQRLAARHARDLLTELGQGYRRVLSEQGPRRLGLGLGLQKQNALVAQRAMGVFARLLAVCFQTYSPTPAGIWSEMHQVYRQALQLNLQDEEPEAGGGRSVNQVYKPALLLALADPYRLLRGEVGHILHYLERFGNEAQLLPASPAVTPTGHFLIRLDGDKPPRPLGPELLPLNPDTDILLNSVDLARLTYQRIVRLEAGHAPQTLGLPEDARDSSYQDMLRRLARQWSVKPKRHFNRTAKPGQVEVCVGVTALHHFSAAECPAAAGQPAAITLQVKSSPIDQHNQQTYTASRWVIVNESAGGFALQSPSTDPAGVRVGKVIGLRLDGVGPWHVGLVRWLVSDAPGRVEIGVQMLAPEATPLWVKPTITAANTQYQPALLLPEVTALRQPARLLTSAGLYYEMREFAIKRDGATQLVRATSLLEQSDSIELFQFQRS